LNYNPGLIYIIIANLAQAFNPIWLKLAFKGGSDPYRILFAQAFFTLPLIFFYILLVDRDKFQVKKENLLTIVIQGICGYFFAAFLYNLAIAKMSASLVALTFYTYPVFTLLGSWLVFKHKIAWLQWLGAVTVIIGVIFIADPRLKGFDLFGFILAFLAAASQAFAILYAERNLKNVHPLTVFLYAQLGFIVPSLLTLPYWPEGPFLDPVSIQYGLILAFLSSCFGFLFVLLGQRTLPSGITALLTTCRLPVSLLFVHLILHEPFSPYMVIGAVLIFAGIVLGMNPLEKVKETEKEKID